MHTTTIAIDTTPQRTLDRLGAWWRHWWGRGSSALPNRLPVGTFVLDARQTLWDDHPLGRVIACEQGAVWLTFDRDCRDIVLEAGQSHRCERAERLAVHALATSQLRTS